jgi:AcrR family transcriptional regulator
MMATTQRSSLKERQRREREKLILQVAEEVILEKGYHEASMDEIAARVGVAKGTVYLHFPGKEEMVGAIFERGMVTFLEGIEAVIADKTSNRAKLEAFLCFMYTGFFTKRTQLMSTIFNNGELHRIFAEKSGYMQEMKDRLMALVTTIIDAGKQAGEFSQAIPTVVQVSSFFCLISPRSYHRLTQEEAISAEALVEYVSQIYFHGIVEN